MFGVDYKIYAIKIADKYYFNKCKIFESRKEKCIEMLEAGIFYMDIVQEAYDEYGEYEIILMEDSIPDDDIIERLQFYLEYYPNYNPFNDKFIFRYIPDTVYKGRTGGIKEVDGLNIYNAYYYGESVEQLAEEYNTSEKRIYKIINCNHWSTKDLLKFNNARRKGKINKKEKGIKIYKEYYDTDITYDELAEKYNLARRTINRIVNRDHWTTEDLHERKKDITKLHWKTCRKIYRLYYDTKKTYKDLADDHNVATTTIRRICKGNHPATEHLEDKQKDKSKIYECYISKEEALDIYNNYEPRMDLKELATWKISVYEVREIVSGRHDHTENLPNIYKRKYVVSEEDVLEIIERAENGESYADINRDFEDVSRRTISQVAKKNHPLCEEMGLT